MRTNSLNLRPAARSDVELLLRWESKPHVTACYPNEFRNWENELASDPTGREHLIAELDGRPIGFVRILDPALTEAPGGDDPLPNRRAVELWIGEEEHLSQGHGTRLMSMVLEHCFASPEVEVVLTAPLLDNIEARRFLVRSGFGFVERRKLGRHDRAVYRVHREAWESRIE